MAAEPDPGIEAHTANKGADFELHGSWSGRFVSARANIVEIPKNRAKAQAIKQLMRFPGTMMLVSQPAEPEPNLKRETVVVANSDDNQGTVIDVQWFVLKSKTDADSERKVDDGCRT